MNHSGGRLQVMRSRKTACEPAPPTPSTHANVQTSKVSPPRTAPLTNLPCRTRQGKREGVRLCTVPLTIVLYLTLRVADYTVRA